MTLAALNQLQREKETRKQIEELHSEYSRLTKLQIPYNIGRERPWYEFIKAGHTKEELATVIAHIKKRIKEKRRGIESLGFRNLIINLDLFQELLAEAKAENRKMELQATGRPMPEDAPVTTAPERESKAFEEFRRWKAEFQKGEA